MAVKVSRRDRSNDRKRMPPSDVGCTPDSRLHLDLAHDIGVNLQVVGHSDGVGG